MNVSIFDFLIFRIKQLYRFLKEQGAYSILFLLFVAFFYVFLVKQLLAVASIWVQLAISFSILTVDQNRKDTPFLNYLKSKGKFFVLAEYLVLWIIIELPFLFFRQPDYYLLIPVIVISALLLLKYHYKITYNTGKFEIIKKVSMILPLHAFEWRCGIRKNKYLFFTSYLLGLLLLLFFPVTPFIMLYWLALSGEFYNQHENKELIQSYKELAVFWSKKIPAFFIAANFLFLPHYVLYVILHHQYEEVITLVFSILIFNMVLVYAALYKYPAAFSNQKYVFNSVPVFIFMFIVLFIPVSFYLIFNLWKSSNQRLQRYLK